MNLTATETIKRIKVSNVLICSVPTLAVIGSIALTSDTENLFSSTPRIIVVAVVVLATLVASIASFKRTTDRSTMVFRGRHLTADVNDYMHNVINTGSKCTISSNNLSWVTDEILDLMKRKAKSGDLELVMPKENDISKELGEAGAKLSYYSANDPDFGFKSRFTLINDGRSDSWVVIGYSSEDHHTIRKVISSDDPVYHLTHDLIDAARRLS